MGNITWITREHECFLCGRSLEESEIVWDKTNRDIDPESKAIYSNGVMIHGVNVMCKCGLCQTFDPMTEEELDLFYCRPSKTKPSPYRKIYTYTREEITNHAITSIQFIMNCINLLSVQQRKLHPDINTCLLVGSGDEETYNIFKAQTPIKEIYTLEPGLPASNINYTSLPNKQFDLIVATNTLEHVYNPIAFLQGLYTLCHPLTKLVLSVPHLLGNTVNMSKDRWFSNAHIYHFDELSLHNCMLKANFEPLIKQVFVEEMGDKIYTMSKIQTISKEVKLPKYTKEEIKDIVLHINEQDKIAKIKRRIVDAAVKKFQFNTGTTN